MHRVVCVYLPLWDSKAYVLLIHTVGRTNVLTTRYRDQVYYVSTYLERWVSPIMCCNCFWAQRGLPLEGKNTLKLYNKVTRQLWPWYYTSIFKPIERKLINHGTEPQKISIAILLLLVLLINSLAGGAAATNNEQTSWLPISSLSVSSTCISGEPRGLSQNSPERSVRRIFSLTWHHIL